MTDLRSTYHMAQSGDAWGDSMEALFAVCFELYHRGDDIPDEWRFRPSPIGRDLRDSEFWRPELQDHESRSLVEFGQILHRYMGMLKAAGKDY